MNDLLRRMNVLVICEESGVVREAFARLGHNAWSCDLQPTAIPSEKHYQGTIENFMCLPIHRWAVGPEGWDLIIAHPPCTHLSVSGARYWKQKRESGEQWEAIKFFIWLTTLKCKRLAIENPVGIMSTFWRKPDQIIQPWQFGEDASKKTCLWLKNLPLLVPTNVILKDRYANQTASGQNKLSPSPERAKLRSKTYQGIADAMAEQWGHLV